MARQERPLEEKRFTEDLRLPLGDAVPRRLTELDVQQLLR
jgi:hypothetical protein